MSSSARAVSSYAPRPSRTAGGGPASGSASGSAAVDGATLLRRDGRCLDQFRSVYLSVGSVSTAAGSAFLELDGTKVLCAVHEPSASSADLREYSATGAMRCDLKFAPFCGPGPRREVRHGDDEKDLSRMVEQALSRSVRFELYPKSVINVHVLVLQARGSVLAAAITCASVALVHAGIECVDLVAACEAARVGEHLLLDPSGEEFAASDSRMTLAYMPNADQVTHVTQAGRLQGAQSTDMIDMCVGGCRTLFQIMRKGLLGEMARAVEEVAAAAAAAEGGPMDVEGEEEGDRPGDP